MWTERKTTRILSFITMVFSAFLLTTASMAQLTCSAGAAATIFHPDDISGIWLTSADGTQFILKNSINSCFDLHIGDLPPVLTGSKGTEEVSYSLSVVHQQTGSFDQIGIRLNVMFSKEVDHGAYLATIPYQISVNYN